jgi:DNA-binding GntR family transcriptional regulator
MKRFTKAEVRIFEQYAHIVRHGRFCTSLPTIAAATGCSSKTVRRANAKFMTLGILSWIRGNGSGPGQPCFPNQYRFDLKGLQKCPP